MIYNVAQLLKAQVGTSLSVELDDSEPLNLEDDSARLIQPVAGKIRFRRTNQGILADGRVQAEVEMACVRCLEPFTSTMAFRLEEEFYPTVDVVTGVFLPETENEMIFGNKNAINEYIID